LLASGPATVPSLRPWPVTASDEFQMRMAQRLAVHDDQPVLRGAGAEELFLPGQQRAFERGGVHADEHVADGRDARAADAPGVFVAAKAQCAQLALVSTGGKESFRPWKVAS
jgi:hypothetical protein